MSDATDSTSRRSLMAMILLGVIMAAGTYIRLRGLGDFAANVDEMMHLLIADGRGLREVWQFSLLETHPPLGHFIRHFWQMTGEGIWHARLLSVVFGVAAIPVYYLVGREMGGRAAGLGGAIVASMGYLPLMQSLLVRNYSLFIFLAGVQFLSFLWLRRRWRFSTLVAYGVFSLLAALTHYGGIFLVFGTGSAIAWKYWKEAGINTRLLVWLALNGAVALAALSLSLAQGFYLAPMMGNQFHGAWAFPFSILQGAWNLGSAALQVLWAPRFFGVAAILLLLYRSQLMKVRQPEVLLAAAGAILLALLLHTVRIFPADEYSRRHLWLIPFVICLVARVSAIAAAGWRAEVSHKSRRVARLQNRAVYVGLVATMVLSGITPSQIWRDDREFTLSRKTPHDLRSHLTSSMQPGDVLLADFHVALYFFHGEHNLYRERFANFGKSTTLEVPLGAGKAVTQPNRRYIQGPIDYSIFAATALADQPRPEGWKVWLVNWSATNPAQKSMLECSRIDKLGHHDFWLSIDQENTMERRKQAPEASVYAIDGEYFLHEVIAPNGISRSCIGAIP